MADLIRRKQPGEAWETAPDTGGGDGGGQTITTELTTDPDTFLIDYALDLGGPGVYSAVVEITAFDLDGETLGGPGGIGAGALNVASLDGVTYEAFTALNGALNAPLSDYDGVWGGATAIGQFWSIAWYVPRFALLRLLVLADGGLIYSGPNHPTVTASLAIQT